MITSAMDPRVFEERAAQPRRRVFKPVKCPTTAPLLTLEAVRAGEHVLRYADSARPGRIAKPEGACDLQLFVALTRSSVAVSPEQARYHRSYTRTPFVVELAWKADGLIATYYARWSTRRGEVGPWSAPLSVRVIGGYRY